jgi:plasmid stabilization system protein ParE
MNVVWSDEAVLALVDLESDLAVRYTPERAREITDAIVAPVGQLEEHPQLGRAVPEFGMWQLRELVDRHHRILYRLTPDRIEIVAIVPARIPLDDRDR